MPFTDVERLALASFVAEHKSKIDLLLLLPDEVIRPYVDVLAELNRREHDAKELMDEMRECEIVAAREMRDEVERKSA